MSEIKKETQSIKATKRSVVQVMVIMAMLIAMEVVLSRFLSYAVWNMKIGFAFLPVAIAAIMLGPVKAAIVGGVADFVGAILFPIGAYFPGFTLTAVLMGLVYGLFLYKKQSLARVLGAVAINQLILSLLLNSLWISVLYGSPYMPLLIARLAQCTIMIPVQVLLIGLITKTLGNFMHKKALQWA